jgi:hypothetical protein
VVPNDAGVMVRLGALHARWVTAGGVLTWRLRLHQHCNCCCERQPLYTALISDLPCLLQAGDEAEATSLADTGHAHTLNTPPRCRLDDEARALHCYSEAHRLWPVDLDVISWLGAYHVRGEMYERAVPFFDLAARVQPQEPKWALMVASCYRRIGECGGSCLAGPLRGRLESCAAACSCAALSTVTVCGNGVVEDARVHQHLACSGAKPAAHAQALACPSAAAA